jgi:hypothetical protein
MKEAVVESKVAAVPVKGSEGLPIQAREQREPCKCDERVWTNVLR